MTDILILKTGALGDVLRTTSLLPGLRRRYPGARVTWLTAEGAVDLVAGHPDVARVVAVRPDDEASVGAACAELAAVPWARVISLDDELPLCRAAARLGAGDGVLFGAYLAAGGERRYTPDSAPWFDMGLLSVHGKAEADRRKAANARSHPAILASMLGVEMGRPELVLPPAAECFAAEFARAHGLAGGGPVIGLNTGAGGRWESKKLPLERVVRIAELVRDALPGRGEEALSCVVLGGPEEEERNARLMAGLGGLAGVRAVDAGTSNPLLRFAALVDRLDLLLTSDSLALHVAVARRVPTVAFFAPTSAAEIELYGLGEKVVSTAPDYCSYRPDADTSTLTPERIAGAVVRTLERGRAPERPRTGT